MTDERETTGEAARDALVRALVVYGVEILFFAAVLIVAHNKPWLEHQWWRVRQYRKRGQARHDALLAELRRDISAYEHGGGP